jgi:hypothetical protein
MPDEGDKRSAFDAPNCGAELSGSCAATRPGACTETEGAQEEPELVSLELTSMYRRARRIAIAIIGASVILVGAAMIVLPGPALVVIPAGLAILGLEFAWARRWLRHLREGTASFLERWSRSRGGRAPRN